MRILVAYYSLEGATRDIAHQLAVALGADTLEIEPVKKFPKTSGWKFVVGGFDSTVNRPCPLKKLDKDPKEYDLWIVGTPVWAWKPAPPILTFLRENPPTEKQLAFFLTHQGSEGKSLERLTEMVKGNGIISTSSFNTAPGNREVLQKEVSKWIQEISEWIGKVE